MALATLVAGGAGAAPAPSMADFAGTWTRTWPPGECRVTVQIRPDGRMTTVDGAHHVDATLDVVGGLDEQGFVPVRRTVATDDGKPACTREPAPGADTSRGNSDQAPSNRLAAILPFADGDAMALCGSDSLGACDDWYERVPAPGRRVAMPARHDLEAAARRQFYALIPENRATFELATSSTALPASMIDRDAPEHFRPVACRHTVRFAVVGHGATGWLFFVASCDDAATIEQLALKLLKDDATVIRADGPPWTPALRRQYGLDPLDRTLADGSRTIYALDELSSIDTSLLMHVAVHVDPGRRHAVLLEGVDMGTLGGPPPQFAGNPLYHDPAAVMQALVERLAKDPDAQ